MDRFLVPGDVATALDAAGYRVVGPAGRDGTGFTARPDDGSDRPVELHVVATALDDVMRARIARLRALRHDHLCRFLDAVELSPGRVGLVVEPVEGPTLDELRAARAPLGDGEAVTVAIPVADALAALHDAGLVHGAVDASTVVVRPDGRPVLVDLRAAVLGLGTPDGDVRRLLATVLGQMPGPDAHLASAAGGAPALRDAFEALLHLPELLAAQVVDACYRTAEPEAVRLPDAGTRAAADLVRAAHRGSSTPAPRRRQRRPRRLVRAGLVAVAALAVASAGTALVVRFAPVADGPSTGASADVDPVLDRTDPVAAAVELSRRRAGVVASAQVAALTRVEVDGGPAFTADSGVVAALAGGHVEGLTVHVADAHLRARPAPGLDAQVALTTSMSTHIRVSADGASRVEVPAAPERTVVLGLRWTDDGWRVWDVTAAPG
ncbi:hypothetical protein Cch01nite_05210 [Cellulomonas chitinilytica]|uniref:Protein kinase domain-containing protein n=1 Tax=Cellulomonas chitinilytica TaxID=398759 RepID=A0A919NYD6_9CELL|nr:hypothetical protein [Cellulomonas chitinilytica]GIG19797.1 hypothetical protein Cch01nite_05210 [Cellulomonas chitinilytica]